MRPELEKLVREGMSRFHVPGVAIGILHDGDEDIAAYGVTNLEHPLPVDIRQTVANLSLFVTNQTVAMLLEPKRAQVADLININRELAAGLLGR